MKRLWDSLSLPGARSSRFIGRYDSIAAADLGEGSLLEDSPEDFRERVVLLLTADQLATAVALLELDGVARRVVLCTPDLSFEQMAAVATLAEADVLLLEAASTIPLTDLAALPRRHLLTKPRRRPIDRSGVLATEWVLLTSGTTGIPKLVVHTLASLAGGLEESQPAPHPAVWSTFYDIRRYGGLQIYLRAVRLGVSLVLSSAGEPVEEFMLRAGAAGVTHISGTPSHWRRALMSGRSDALRPEYVRLSGEVADQPLLDALRLAYPAARIGHAFASTEAGVGFDVNDGLAGFPASYVETGRAGVALKVEDGTLRIRSPRNAQCYLGDAAPALRRADGYVDTGDLVERVSDRYYFRGRRGGVINVGGLKVYPEEVEAVLAADPRVRMARVQPRRSPITGALVMAEVVLTQMPPDADSLAAVQSDLLNLCRGALPPHKVPALLRVVAQLPLTAAGKLMRVDA